MQAGAPAGRGLARRAPARPVIANGPVDGMRSAGRRRGRLRPAIPAKHRARRSWGRCALCGSVHAIRARHRCQAIDRNHRTNNVVLSTHASDNHDPALFRRSKSNRRAYPQQPEPANKNDTEMRLLLQKCHVCDWMLRADRNAACFQNLSNRNVTTRLQGPRRPSHDAKERSDHEIIVPIPAPLPVHRGRRCRLPGARHGRTCRSPDIDRDGHSGQGPHEGARQDPSRQDA